MATLYDHIACCIDASAASERALVEARRLRGFGSGRLSLVHVAPPPLAYSIGFGATLPEPIPVSEPARRWLDGIAADVREAGAVLLDGHPGSAACAWAELYEVDLLICAARSNLLQRLTLGSFAHHLVNNAPCPVLVLRGGAGGSDPAG